MVVVGWEEITMNSFLSGVAAALLIAIGAWAVLDQVQKPAERAYITTGARI